MLIKKISLIVALIILIISNLFSQSKIETEYWINSKFVTHKLYSSFTNDDNFKIYVSPDYLSFDDCVMTLKTTSQNRVGPDFEAIHELNIGDIKSIVWKNNTITFTSNKYNINYKGRMVGESLYQHINFVNTLEFKIQGNAEHKLRERMVKAFNHLKTFCKPSKFEKEPF